jgi:Uma2 family endonuclease
MALRWPERTWTYEDLKALPDDGKRYEIIEGELFELTGPKLLHAMAIMNLIRLLDPEVLRAKGALFTAVLDVFFADADPVEPDLVILLPGGVARRTMRGIEGPPDLIVEVVSPSNRTHDVLTKRALYNRGGVREYWIVDPEHRTVEVVSFNAAGSGGARVFAGEEIVVSALLPDLAFPASAAFAGFDEVVAE